MVEMNLDQPESKDGSDLLKSGRGDFLFIGNLHIDGNFSGRLTITGVLYLGQYARVTGEIDATNLVCNGYLAGNVKIARKVIFEENAVFSGTLSAAEAEIYKGCSLGGMRNIGRVIEKDRTGDKNIRNKSIMDIISIPDEIVFPKEPR